MPVTVDVVIPAHGGRVSVLGMYTLRFPANSVCDPNAQDSQDGYAARDWDAACKPATGDIALHATLKWSKGRLWVDFAPALRFVPDATVTISTDILAPIVRYYGQSAITSGLANNWGIGYAPSIEGQGVDDSRDDRSLRTRIDLGTGRVWRRIKHFSGYFIVAALTYTPCTPGDNNPNCIWYDVDPT